MTDISKGRVEFYAELASKQLANNLECFVAQWVLQNPDAMVADYTLVVKNDWINGHEYSMRKKYD